MFDTRRSNILRANLYHAWRSGGRGKQQSPVIEIVCEDDITIFTRQAMISVSKAEGDQWNSNEHEVGRPRILKLANADLFI